MPAEIPSIIYSNNRSIRGESNKNAAKRYLEITLNSARYNKEGNLTGVGVFDQVDLKKLRNGELDKSIKFKLALNDSITALICNKENIKRNRNKNSMNWTVKPEWSLIALEIDCFIRIFEENADINSLFCNGQLLSKFKFIYKVLREFGFKDDNLKKITALI